MADIWNTKGFGGKCVTLDFHFIVAQEEGQISSVGRVRER